MNIHISLIRDRLSDGSEAFGIRIAAPGDGRVDLDCFGERHAESLMHALAEALILHGLDPAMTADAIRKNAGWEV
jgi:hypothetical protein